MFMFFFYTFWLVSAFVLSNIFDCTAVNTVITISLSRLFCVYISKSEISPSDFRVVFLLIRQFARRDWKVSPSVLKLASSGDSFRFGLILCPMYRIGLFGNGFL